MSGSITVLEWVEIRGRGMLAVISEKDRERVRLGEAILLEGKTYIVAGIERPAINGCFGVLVR